ncbi:16S rRNA (guanine(527)-N(7))-methyltransferase RsmG [Thermodesulforhabdus norvegica]|uniref:Ribosomal RNA small subunit methyltransferase G n=1 Tax=Thermodesulforhabdus norvegica TaxID=39841 RepID=A0A1I4TDG9_9BACT|nr:RsmG family class I SAM-dependent methyltransferase [Thermodesulforhabdus norvegica]SFM74726.1 16S rRNA (guanine527-N7)-methyltransferase [Thermodesulforhabdus norvegica]
MHAGLLMYWNRKVNLTGMASWDEILLRHYMDSLVPLSMLPPGKLLLDIGSGAGFPGIPAKALYPETHVVLCDMKRKKTSFLKTFIAYSGLRNVSVVQASWESLLANPESSGIFVSEGYDLIISRALKLTTRDISLILDRGIRDRGALVLWTGPKALKEARGNLKGINFEVREYDLLEGLPRAVLIFRKM